MNQMTTAEIITRLIALERQFQRQGLGERFPSTFTSLTDVPQTYVGQALKLLQVNAGATALEFITGLQNDTQHGTRGGGTQHADATTSVSGFLSGADKTKLNQFAPAASKTLTVSNSMTLAGVSDGLSLTLGNTGTLYTNIGARVYNNANQSVATSSNTVLTYNSERYDTDTIHSTVSNTGRLTATTAGKYLIISLVQFEANTTGFRQINIRLNGATTIARAQHDAVTVASIASIEIAVCTYDLAATDYVETVAFQDSGSSLNVLSTANLSPEFMMHRIA